MQEPTIVGSKQGTRLLVFAFLFVLGLVVRLITSPAIRLCWTQPNATQLFIDHSAKALKVARWSGGPPLCDENPYAGALQESLDEISYRMDLWVDAIGNHHEKATTENERDHGRFFPFDAMAMCAERSCVGGSCNADTSKIVCGLQELSKDTFSKNETCVVYSIGGNNQWEFEVDILKKTPCEVHTFDCTGPLDRFRKPRNDRLKFHHVCLGARHEDTPASECAGKAKCGETWTLLEMQQSLGHQRIDLLKNWTLKPTNGRFSNRGQSLRILPPQRLFCLFKSLWNFIMTRGRPIYSPPVRASEPSFALVVTW